MTDFVIISAVPKFIVAEITKNWPQKNAEPLLISQNFQNVINQNFEKGYRLIDWKMTATLTKDSLVETIVAVFELICVSNVAESKIPFVGANEKDADISNLKRVVPAT